MAVHQSIIFSFSDFIICFLFRKTLTSVSVIGLFLGGGRGGMVGLNKIVRFHTFFEESAECGTA